MKELVKRFIRLLIVLIYGLGLVLFFQTYVPLVRPFLLLLVPLLGLTAFLTMFRPRSGIYLFIFLVPLINNFPYYFGIHEDIPHAPTALVLFLFFFLGILVRYLFGKPLGFRAGKLSLPLSLFLGWVFLSGIITFFRYADFFPFLDRPFFDYVTNTFGVSAGGAMMSVVFTTLSYLSAFSVFLLAGTLLHTKSEGRRAVFFLITSVFLSSIVGGIQLLTGREWGNSMISFGHDLVGGTFKDSLSFGVALAMAASLLLGLASRPGCGAAFRWLYVPFVPMVILIFFTGSKGALVSILLAAVFIFSVNRTAARRIHQGGDIRRSRARPAGIVILVVLALVGGYIGFQSGQENQSSTLSRLNYMFKEGPLQLMASWRGRLWESAVRMMGQYPLTGVGCGAYIIELSNFNTEYRSREVSQSAENYWLHAGAELGFAGLLLLLWIGVVLYTRFRRILPGAYGADSDGAWIVGLSAGMIVYAVNLFFHTYIWSYEVGYIFWIFLAVYLTIGEREPKGLSDQKRGGARITAACLVVFLLGGVHLWNSFHSLSIENRTRSLGLFQQFGLYVKERNPEVGRFHWTGKTAGLLIDVKKPYLFLPMHVSHPDVRQKPVGVRLRLIVDSFHRKVDLDEFELINDAWETKSYDLHEMMGRRVILLIEVDRTWNPQRDKGIPDPRNLGVAVGLPYFRGKRPG
ncbi:MAG: O-antigen ligase family protein [Acidobacteria bacterium]|nr:O-antigen ligase family protein [Acidobacteriota bacterium]